jgi:hypothetical protein
MQRSKPPSELARDAERARLEREATRLIRAADRKRRAVRQRKSPPPPNQQRLTLADLGWLRKAGRVP